MWGQHFNSNLHCVILVPKPSNIALYHTGTADCWEPRTLSGFSSRSAKYLLHDHWQVIATSLSVERMQIFEAKEFLHRVIPIDWYRHFCGIGAHDKLPVHQPSAWVLLAGVVASCPVPGNFVSCIWEIS